MRVYRCAHRGVRATSVWMSVYIGEYAGEGGSVTVSNVLWDHVRDRVVTVGVPTRLQSRTWQ